MIERVVLPEGVILSGVLAHSCAKRSRRICVYAGHGQVRVWLPRVSLLRPAETLIKLFDCVLKGYGFSRADMDSEGNSWALALEKTYFQQLAFPRRLEPAPLSAILAARLKPCTFKTGLDQSFPGCSSGQHRPRSNHWQYLPCSFAPHRPLCATMADRSRSSPLARSLPGWRRPPAAAVCRTFELLDAQAHHSPRLLPCPTAR